MNETQIFSGKEKKTSIYTVQNLSLNSLNKLI